MHWIRIDKTELDDWNEILKSTDASFFQYPYYASGYEHFFLSTPVYLKFVNEAGNAAAFCTILKIGYYPLKFGLMIRGPVLLDKTLEVKKVLAAIKQYAKTYKYAFLRINPDAEDIEKALQQDADFVQLDYFPAYKGSQSKDFNVYNMPEENLIASFRRDCRNKIKFADELGFEYGFATNDAALKEVYELFKSLGKNKDFKYRPYKSYRSILFNGMKHNLCSVYTAKLNGRMVCAAFIVKDKASFNYFSGALLLGEIRAKNSPANKLQYLAIRDCFYKENKPHYNLSYSSPDSGVHMFKDSFHPQVNEKPLYYTYVINRRVSEFMLHLQQNRLKQIKSFFRRTIKLAKG